MLRYFQLLVVSMGLLGCTLPAKEIEELRLSVQTNRIRVYQNHLRICGTFGFACRTAAKNQDESSLCLELIEQCASEAQMSYEKDTGKEPPGFETK